MREPVSGLIGEDCIGLFVDLYELTMGKADFDHKNYDIITENYFVRRIPQGFYLITAGLEQVVHYIKNLRFSREDLDWLKKTSENNFSNEFLEYLESFEFKGDIYAIPEGTPVFPNEPIINVTGSPIDVQLFETYLLNVMNFQTLIATKTSRIVNATRGRVVVDFGARRAHGRDAAVLGSRAAYIGGANGTSLVIGGKIWNIPYFGTMAHKFIQDRDSELQAFREYSESFPHNSMLLIDTYNTLQGAKNACKIGRELRERGYDLKGVRLDSGDLLDLSKKVRKILDEGGFVQTKIFVSSDLDEFQIERLLSNGAPIDGFGVGTRLITGANYNSITKTGGVSALGGVYKIVEKMDSDGRPIPKIKISDEKEKTLLPARKQVYRKVEDGKYVEDVIALWDERLDYDDVYPLLVPIIKNGEFIYDFPPVSEIREFSLKEVSKLPNSFKQINNSEIYPVRISPGLSELRDQLIELYSSY